MLLISYLRLDQLPTLTEIRSHNSLKTQFFIISPTNIKFSHTHQVKMKSEISKLEQIYIFILNN